MKKTYSIFWVIFLLINLSCEENLEEVPLSFLEESNSFNSADDAESAINGVYDRLKSVFGMTMITLSDLNSDQCEVREDNAAGAEIHQNLYNSGTGFFDSYYTNSYITIDRANRVLANVPDISMDEELKARVLGEAKFIRALVYFNLVRAYGDVPLITEISNDVINVEVERTSVSSVYEQIIQDLLDAEVVLPETITEASNIGRATSGAAKSILAKVYLTKQDWSNAAEKAKEVIDSDVYDLFEDYHHIFKPEMENGIEHIFSIQYSCILPQYGSSMALNFAIYFSYPINLVGGSYQATPEHVTTYAEGDYRKEVTIINEKVIADGTVVESRTGPHVDKYWDPLACGQTAARNNFMVIRFADVLLMYAEAVNEIEGPSATAYEAINRVRQRARNGVETAAPQDLTGLTQDQFRAAVLQERGWELCFEGHRRWDLLRTGNYIEAMESVGVETQEKHLLYPIPQNEIDVNPALTQNTGY